MSTPDASPIQPANKAILAKLFSHPSNSYIERLTKILSTQAGIDSTLLMVGYGLAFVSGQLTRLLNSNIKAVTDRAAEKAPGESLVAMLPLPLTVERVTNLRDGSKILSGMCADTRAFMRLWGLLKMWVMARGVYFSPPKDSIIHALTWGKILTISTYYALEHGFYLGGKGVYKGWKPEDIGKWFRTGIYAYSIYLICDYASLWRMSALEEQSPEKDSVKKENDDRQWWKAIQVDAGYTPLCFHWARPGGLLPDDAVGFLGAFAGFASVREAWRQTA